MMNEPLDPTGPGTPAPRRGATPARSGAQGGLGRSLPEIFDLVPRATVATDTPASLDQELVLRELGALRHDLRAIEERLVHLMIDLAQSTPGTPGETAKPKKAKGKKAKGKKAARR